MHGVAPAIMVLLHASQDDNFEMFALSLLKTAIIECVTCSGYLSNLCYPACHLTTQEPFDPRSCLSYTQIYQQDQDNQIRY